MAFLFTSYQKYAQKDCKNVRQETETVILGILREDLKLSGMWGKLGIKNLEHQTGQFMIFPKTKTVTITVKYQHFPSFSNQIAYHKNLQKLLKK